MTPASFVRRSELAVPVEALFDWHARPGAFDRLAPPWEDVHVESPAGSLRDGERVVLRVPAPPFVDGRWVAEIRDVRRPHGFRDVQISGPFGAWEHRHEMRPGATPGTSSIEDRIEFALPFGPLGRLGAGIVRRRLDQLFRYRHAVTRDDLAQLASLTGVRPMKILVTGASGLVGTALVPFLEAAGHTVVRAVRGRAADGEIAWDPAAGRMDPAALEGVDAVVHLAGESVAAGRWSPAVKQRILASRVDGTGLVARTIAAMKRKPKVLVCASAVGIYGDRGDEQLDAASPRGTGFLADVCDAWERAADPARAAGVRVVHLRTGLVLSPKGGALAKMLTPFKMGAGGVLGSGKQWMPCVSIDDLIGIVLHAIATESLSGPVEAVGPAPVTNHDFTKTLGRVLSRPTMFPMPAFAVGLLFGEMGRSLLLGSTRVVPTKLAASGYRFRHTDVESALRHVLGK
ncbi:MAG: TIGR01777 family oxidoreductase [Planctomycetes bacterium]|nr:TIGR01777 family oxidoreductase [Planctomycetota bacterium]